MPLSVLLAIVGRAVFSWFVWTVRCPLCRGSPMWVLVNAADFRRVWDLIWAQPICPLRHDGQEQLPPLFSPDHLM